MSVEKKSLISNLAAAKKAVVASKSTAIAPQDAKTNAFAKNTFAKNTFAKAKS